MTRRRRRVVRVKDGSLVTKIVNARHRPYSGGAGIWLGDTDKLTACP